jgi:hypothetical protein
MRRTSRIVLGLAALLSLPTLLPAAPTTDRLPVVAEANRIDADALATRIDQRLLHHWASLGVRPAPRSDDGEFLRRAYLDLAGRIPPIYEARDFLEDPAPDKRARLIERLLATPVYRMHFAAVWRAVLLPANNDFRGNFLQNAFEGWLQQRLGENAGYDRLVTEMLAGQNGMRGSPSADAFAQAQENQPDRWAANTSRLFLGLNLECAQCHNHPFDTWTRQQFWEYAAFFGTAPAADEKSRAIAIPNTDKKASPRFPDGSAPQWSARDDRRGKLAAWMTTADNPFFARAAVNHVWAYFFGYGLVEPDTGREEPASLQHPELLDELAGQFVAHGYDLKYLIQAVTNSQTYQRSSSGGDPSPPRLFARMTLRGLSAEQLYDSLLEATGTEEPPASGRPAFGSAVNSRRALFVTKFANLSRRTETTTSALQALHLMNGPLITEVTNPERNVVLQTVATAAVPTSRRVEELYLTTLSRKPRPEELTRMVGYVERGGATGDHRQALADIFWALLNSSEFLINH